MLHHFAIGRVLVNDGFEGLQVGDFFIGIDAGREETEPVGGHRGALVAAALNDGAKIVAVAIGRENHVPAIVHFEKDGIVFVGDGGLREIAFLAGFRIFLDEAHGARRADGSAEITMACLYLPPVRRCFSRTLVTCSWFPLITMA